MLEYEQAKLAETRALTPIILKKKKKKKKRNAGKDFRPMRRKDVADRGLVTCIMNSDIL